jgi:ABC-type uncharacterized transport system permease subunit
LINLLDYNLLGSNTVQFLRWLPTFWRNLLPPSTLMRETEKNLFEHLFSFHIILFCSVFTGIYLRGKIIAMHMKKLSPVVKKVCAEYVSGVKVKR